MTARPSADARPRAHEIAIVGNDMVLAALPARPVQLAHAVLACGFDLVVPVSWGEELLAEQALSVLDSADGRPMVFCACSRVRARLLQSGPELAPRLFSCVPPPVATARYLRALQPDATARITYLGACEGAKDPAIDARVSPQDFLRHLEVSGVSLVRQSSVFDSVVPPDRRRHLSLPGGVPAADHVSQHGPGYRLVMAGPADLAVDLADHLIAGESVLVDVAVPLGCACAGAVTGLASGTGRDVIASLEPPRSLSRIVESEVLLQLQSPLSEPQIETSPRRVRQLGDMLTGMPVPGVRSIEVARRKAERRKFAVTPASVHPTVTSGESEPGATNSLQQTAAGETPRPGEPNVVVPTPESVEPPDVWLGRAESTDPEISAGPSEASPAGTSAHELLPGEGEESLGRAPSSSPWYVARVSTPPQARAGLTLVPRAYASRRQRPKQVASVAEPAPDPLARTVAAEVAPVEPVDAAAPAAVSPEAESRRDSPAGEPETPTRPGPLFPSTLAGPADVNEYVTIKQRMAQRRLHGRPRSVPPVEEARGERLWRLLAYVLLILALTVATLAIVQR